MANLTQAEIDALIAELQTYPYAVAFGDTELGPLVEGPSIEPEVTLTPVTLYETGKDEQGMMLDKNDVRITLRSRKFDEAVALKSDFKLGENVYAAGRARALILVPITADAAAKTFTFPRAFLQPGLQPTTGDGATPLDETLIFVCKPDGDSKLPWTHAAAAGAEG